MLHHRKQTELWGCLYHSAFALTGDQTLLAHTSDISDPRFQARLIEHGWMLSTLYAYRGPPQPADALFWLHLRDQLPPGEGAGLLVAIDAHNIPGCWHSVALMLVNSGRVSVSDSRLPDLIEYPDLWTFIASPYSQAHQVQVLLPTEVDAYPYEDAQLVVGRALASTGPPRPGYEM